MLLHIIFGQVGGVDAIEQHTRTIERFRECLVNDNVELLQTLELSPEFVNVMGIILQKHPLDAACVHQAYKCIAFLLSERFHDSSFTIKVLAHACALSNHRLLHLGFRHGAALEESGFLKLIHGCWRFEECDWKTTLRALHLQIGLCEERLPTNCTCGFEERKHYSQALEARKKTCHKSIITLMLCLYETEVVEADVVPMVGRFLLDTRIDKAWH